MPPQKRARIFVRLAATLVIAAGLLSAAACARAPEPPAGLSDMEGYVSRYHPGHIDSAGAWQLAQSDSRAVILDVRSEASYLERHVSGAVNVPLETLADYAAAHLPEKDAVILCYCFCGDSGGAALAAYEQLTALGYTNVSYVEPEDEWTYEGTLVTPPSSDRPAEAVPGLVTGDEARALYEDNPGAVLLDVRNPDEYAEKHIEGSTLIPVDELASRLAELPDRNAVIIVYCKGGVRSAAAVDILTSAGYIRVYNMQRVDSWPLPLVEG